MEHIMIISLFMGIDQFIKVIVKHHLEKRKSLSFFNRHLSISYVENSGGPLGIFRGKRWFIIGFSLIIMVGLVLLYYQDLNLSNNFLETLGFILIMSGGVSNLFDRIVYGYVVDYISFKVFKKHSPIFNFADFMIVTGMIMLITQIFQLLQTSF